jgi:hypothetical protein
MIRHRSKSQVRLYDLVKLVVLLIPLAIAAFLIWSTAGPSAAETTPVAEISPTAPQVTPPTPPPSPTGVTEPTATATVIENTPEPTLTPTATPLVVASLNLPEDTLQTGPITLTGAGQPGSRVEVVVNGQVIGMAIVGADGTWRIDTTLPEAGTSTVVVRTVDANGIVISESAPLTLAVAAQNTTDFSPPAVNLPAGGTFIANSPIDLTGTGPANSRMEIVLNDNLIDTVPVDETNTWQYSTTLTEPGDYTLLLRAIDDTGSLLAQSEPLPLRVTAPTTLNPLPEGGVTAGIIPLSGSGQPGQVIEMVVDGQIITSTTVGNDGAWAALLPLERPGEYQLALRTLETNGALLAESEPVQVRVKAAPPVLEQPIATEITAGEEELSGSGTPGSIIEVVAAGAVIGTTTAGDDGQWRLTVQTPPPGEYEIVLQVVDEQGQVVVAAAPVRFTVTSPGQEYVVQADDWLSKLSDKFYGDIFAYPIIVEATNTRAAEDATFAVIDNPDLIEIGQKLWIPEVTTLPQTEP